jgi:hypothetical protein
MVPLYTGEVGVRGFSRPAWDLFLKHNARGCLTPRVEFCFVCLFFFGWVEYSCFAVMLGFAVVFAFILQARSTLSMSGRLSAWWWWFSGRIKLWWLHNANGFVHWTTNIKNRKTLNCLKWAHLRAWAPHPRRGPKVAPFDPLAGKCFVHPGDVHELWV